MAAFSVKNQTVKFAAVAFNGNGNVSGIKQLTAHVIHRIVGHVNARERIRRADGMNLVVSGFQADLD